MQPIQLSIIIVNYNTKDLIFNCITSLKTKTQGLSYEIIVIDNASHDQSVEFLQEQFPDITIQALPENIGFGRANNIGANIAKGEVLFLLNSDTIIIDNSIKTLYDYLTTHPTNRCLWWFTFKRRWEYRIFSRSATITFTLFSFFHTIFTLKTFRSQLNCYRCRLYSWGRYDDKKRSI